MNCPGSAQVAMVAVSGTVFSIDIPYDYAVPDSMRQTICPGCRVLVPFGAGNRHREGFVLALRDKSRFSKLKSINLLLDMEPVLDAESIKLALWMHKRLFCTFFEAARAMLPAGLWFAYTETLRIPEGVDAQEVRTALEKTPDAISVFEGILAAGGFMKREEVASLCVNPSDAIKILMERGFLAGDSQAKRRTGDKMLRFARLAVGIEDALAYAAARTHSARQQKAALLFLCETERVSVKELCYYTGASPAVIANLAKKNLIVLEEQVYFRRPSASAEPREPFELNGKQMEVFSRLRLFLDEGIRRCALLRGVTGSGKTPVYIELIRHVLKAGGGAIVLVPEIALTPQFMGLFSGVFGDRVALLHSGLSLGQRMDEWKRIKTGLATVVLGTRSAVFAPVSNLRLIVIDEEQEHTYKSENSPRYHARDIAKYRVAAHNGLLLLGSATPSVESNYYAGSGRYELQNLPERYNQNPLPQVFIADMRRELANGNPTCISSVLREEIRQNLENRRQSILFLNRRGYNRMLVCGECGGTPGCERCSVSLTYHAANERLMCHQCGHSEKKSDACPNCGAALQPVGYGTQHVERDLHLLFPGCEVMRMDADTTGGQGAVEEILRKFSERRVPILIGTQMVTKGLDFPLVTLVGVLDADLALYVSDFRASERAFGLITQVVGRAGRGGESGRAVIQTFTPGSPVIRAAAAQDYETFYQNEIGVRRVLGLPPFLDLILISLSGCGEEAVRQACLRVVSRLKDHGGLLSRVLGPAPYPILKVNNRYRYRITLTGTVNAAVRGFLSSVLSAFEKDGKNRGVSMHIDTYPL